MSVVRQSGEAGRVFRVRLTTWDRYVMTVDAPDAGAAEDIVHELWLKDGLEAFEILDGGVEHIDVREIIAKEEARS